MLPSHIPSNLAPLSMPAMALKLLYPTLTAMALLPLQAFSAAEPKVFGLNFVKIKRDAEASTLRLERRASSVTEALLNTQQMYIANVTVGKCFSEQLVLKG